ncbi:hypothetical protein [Lactobacillus sp. ESL0261]|uniref:hypothetical protein n=1 Tax=Lactobacillus sp. ESL0261 TaxID=2069348 RepID=UPI000EFC5DCE|nr:hypothetical protein [Lactobacillus sp. ESL0261]RMC55073.1 hypothetical protein F5ESL0261_04065 [Lactobacillus sp. ESL0261]
MLMNGKEVNNLIIAGQQFSAVKNSLIGTNVQVKKGQTVYYVGDVSLATTGRFSIGSTSKDEIVPVKQCLFLIKKTKPEDGEYWIQVQISFSGEGNKFFYVSTPCYIRLSDITIKSEVGGVNSPSYLLIIYNMREVAPLC